MKKPKLIVLLLTFFSLLGFFSFKYLLRGENPIVTRVIDGDTIELSDDRIIRYIGIDSPELATEECFSQEAKKLNQDLVLNQKVRVELDTNQMDRFGRYLAYVYAKDAKKEVFVNQYLLEQGAGEFFLDTVNLKYQSELVKAAEKGYSEKKGKWSACALDQQGCIIKANLDKLDKRWYHLPGFRHYDQVKINLEKGDRWFCTEEEAIKAGFEKARI